MKKVQKSLAMTVSLWYFIKAVGPKPASHSYYGRSSGDRHRVWRLQERLERKERIT
jgi:hypothetical protein